MNFIEILLYITKKTLRLRDFSFFFLQATVEALWVMGVLRNLFNLKEGRVRCFQIPI